MKKTTAAIILALSLVVASCGDAGPGGAEELSLKGSSPPTTAVISTTESPVLAEPVPLLVIAETGDAS